MIELTDEMRAAVKRRMGIAESDELDPWMGPAIGDVLALVERDRCLQPRGHLYHPLAASKPNRGAMHPHYCVSCSNGETKGPGCINCRQTGFDQTPWPTCGGCSS